MLPKIFPVSLFLLVLSLSSGARADEPVEVGFPDPETVLTFEDRTGEQVQKVRWTVREPVERNGRKVHRLVSGEDFMLFDAETKGWVATRHDGRLKEVSPHNGQMSSPLYVGKEWTSRYLYTRRDGSESEQKRRWRVEAFEEVTVPAGTFEAFRIVSPGKVLSITLWYAPELAFYVKRTTRGMVDIEQRLVAFEQP